MRYLKDWAVITEEGVLMGVPVGITSKYEDVAVYGHQAILERFRRHPAVKKAASTGLTIRVKALVLNGKVISQI